jgi:hypothetical protein
MCFERGGFMAGMRRMTPEEKKVCNRAVLIIFTGIITVFSPFWIYDFIRLKRYKYLLEMPLLVKISFFVILAVLLYMGAVVIFEHMNKKLDKKEEDLDRK